LNERLARLAINGGDPVRPTMLPYGRQTIDDDDVAAVCAVLRSDWLTTGPHVGQFEQAAAAAVQAQHAVAVSSGTAALHACMFAAGIANGDEVIVPAMTFAASANCVLYQGGTPVIVDVDPATLLIDPAAVAAKITSRTRAILAVDFAGQPCDYHALRALAARHGLLLIADGCHAMGAAWEGRSIGSVADMTAFSLHPVKHITTGEGGLVATDRSDLAERMRHFRNHGISTDLRQREQAGSWFYEMVDLGYNYRITDFQCALGRSQLPKLPDWVRRRQDIARRYDEGLTGNAFVAPLARRNNVLHAYHLYVVQLRLERLTASRKEIFTALRSEGIGVNVHYIPVHLHPYYRRRLGTKPGDCPIAEAAYERILSLPIYPAMSDSDVASVITAMRKVLEAYAA
jgi:perosamine synthetase